MVMPHLLFHILIALLFLLCLFFILVRYLESAGVFFPSRDIPVGPQILELPCEDIYFQTQDGIRINAWLFKNPDAKSTLIFAHGNAGNMSDRLLKVRVFYEFGLNVFIFDYRGYGKSEGRPSEQGIYLDAQGAYDYLQSRQDINMNNIILYGASLGGVVVVNLATCRKAALLVVESSITHARDMARIIYPFVPAVFLSLKFDSIGKVKAMTMPKLFIHSPEDQIVPYWIGQKLFEAAAEPKEFLQIHGGHNDGSITAEPVAAAEFIRILKNKDLI